MLGEVSLERGEDLGGGVLAEEGPGGGDVAHHLVSVLRAREPAQRGEGATGDHGLGDDDLSGEGGGVDPLEGVGEELTLEHIGRLNVVFEVDEGDRWRLTATDKASQTLDARVPFIIREGAFEVEPKPVRGAAKDHHKAMYGVEVG